MYIITYYRFSYEIVVNVEEKEKTFFQADGLSTTKQNKVLTRVGHLLAYLVLVHGQKTMLKDTCFQTAQEIKHSLLRAVKCDNAVTRDCFSENTVSSAVSEHTV